MSHQQSNKNQEDPFADFTSFQEFGKKKKASTGWTGFKAGIPEQKEFEDFDFSSSNFYYFYIRRIWNI